MNVGDKVEIINGEHRGKLGVIIDFPWNGYATVRIGNGVHDAVDIPLIYLKLLK